MKESSEDGANFLPGGTIPEAYALASVQFKREDLEKIASGDDPAAFPMPANIEPTWGLLYASVESLGFFVHPNESPMALLFQASRSKRAEAIRLDVPYTDVLRATFSYPRQPRSAIGKFLIRYSARPEAEFTVTWKGIENEYTARFFVARKAIDLERCLGSKIPVVRTEKGARAG